MANWSFNKIWPRVTFALTVSALIIVACYTPGWCTRWNENHYRHQCQTFRKLRQWKQLESAASAWTDWQPSNSEAWMFRSEAAEAVDDQENVAAFLGKVSEHDSRAVAAYVERARVLFEKLDRPREAIEVYEHVLRLNPKISIAHRRIIFFYALTLQRAKMIQSIRDALLAEREPPEAYVYLFGAHWIVFGNQYELNSRWLEHEPDNENYVVARAIQVIQSGAQDNPKTADRFKDVPSAEELLQLFPKNVEVLAILVDRAIEAGDLDRVSALLDQVPEHAKADYRFWLAQGWCLTATNQLNDAESALLHALEVDRLGWKANHYLADVYRQMGRNKDVVEFERRYKIAKEIHDEITRLQDATSLSNDLLEKIARYARECGDVLVADALLNRLSNSTGNASQN